MKKENSDKMNDKIDLGNMLADLLINIIENHEIKEEMTHKEFVDEMEKYVESLKDSPLEDNIPFIKKEKRYEIVNRFKNIVLDYVKLQKDINNYLITKKDDLSKEERREMLLDYLDEV